jgi:hypothetical protein
MMAVMVVMVAVVVAVVTESRRRSFVLLIEAEAAFAARRRPLPWPRRGQSHESEATQNKGEPHFIWDRCYETPIFSPKNVIITSTPGKQWSHYTYQAIFSNFSNFQRFFANFRRKNWHFLHIQCYYECFALSA